MTSVPKHWIVAGYTPPTDPTNPADTGALGTIGGAVGGAGGAVYFTLVDAQNAARAYAAASPGAIFVVYEAQWWAESDITPVTLRQVVFSSI